MKKHLLLCGAIALSLVGVMFVAQADHREIKVDRYGNEYYESRGPVKGTLDGIGNIFGGKKRYLDRGPREEGNDGLSRRYNQGNPPYNNYRR